jgi:hypothetical protein
MTVKLLKHILRGLPESSVVKLSVDGKPIDIEVVGITRFKELPDPKHFNSIKEFVFLGDNTGLASVEKSVDVKKLWKYIPGKEAV